MLYRRSFSTLLYDRSIWKATKKFKRPTVAIPPSRNTNGDWARTDAEKACVFANYLAKVFTPLPENNTEDELEIKAYLAAPCQLDLPLKYFSPKEVKNEINKICSRKIPGYDLIVSEILKRLTRKALVLLTVIHNSMLQLFYYPLQWKFAQIIMILKP
jgi:hypothetical protein